MSSIKIVKQWVLVNSVDNSVFPVHVEPISDSVWLTVQGDRAVGAFLVQDYPNGDYWSEVDNGDLEKIDHDMDNGGDIIEEAAQKGRKAFLISGNGRYSDAKFCRVDSWGQKVDHIYVLPEDVEEGKAESYCDSVMEEYTNWCNGEVYGICINTYKKEGDKWVVENEDHCYGYIGWDETIKLMKAEFQSALENIKE